MRRVSRACWNAADALRWRLLLVLAAALLASCARTAETQALHFTQALLRVEHAAAFAPAPALLRPQDLPVDATPTPLPHIWARDVIPGGAQAMPVQTTWLHVDLSQVSSAPGGTWLYLPRWQTIGQIAVYGDTRLLYRSQADLVWNGFNHPLWIALDARGQQPLPRWLSLRVDSQKAAGGAVSSLWIGSTPALQPRYELRRQLQVELPALTGVAVLGLGAFAFAVWLRRRHETMYLLFALFAALSTLRGLHFHVGLAPLPIPREWFGWMTVNAVTAMLVVWYYFVASLVALPARWIGRALCVLLLASSIATLPPLAVLPGMDRLAPLLYLIAIGAGVPTVLLLAWVAWRRGGPEARLAASIGVLDAAVAVHDWMMQNFFIGPEAFYLGPVLTLVRLVMFVYVILRRYVGAVDEAEQANARLALRLREREAALAQSYEQLREVQQRQVLSRERQRLMQDIHDGMGSQLMSALRVAESGQLTDIRMAAVLRECIDDLKLTVDSLEPVEADLLLLLATLRYRLEPRLQGSGIVLRWDVQDLPALPWLDPRSALHVLRILQEGIANVIQHARATALHVGTEQHADGVSVLLRDNGTGFDAHARTAGKGLPNMQRRAEMLGGRIDWESRASGTCLRLWLPLHRAVDASAALP